MGFKFRRRSKAVLVLKLTTPCLVVFLGGLPYPIRSVTVFLFRVAVRFGAFPVLRCFLGLRSLLLEDSFV